MTDEVATQKDDVDLTGEDASKKQHKRWTEEISFYETKAQDWEARGNKILRRYKDERSAREQRVPRFNILWSNIQTLMPALYARVPKPDVERRFRDNDPVGRSAAMVLERAISFYMNEEYDLAVKNAVLDRLLPGRGLVWARYEPHFINKPLGDEEEREDGYQISDNVEGYQGESEYAEGKAQGDEPRDPPSTVETLDHEVLAWDYVHWKDFGHCYGRTWDEVPGAWRKVYLTREQLIARFGEEIGKAIKLDYAPEDLKKGKLDNVVKKATIYEIWSKEDKKVYWFHKDYEQGMLDEKDDPLEVDGFWPFPMPMFATLDNNSLFPTADYVEYQDQAAELDEITSRIASITKSVKVVGVYDASAEGIQRILAEGIENQLVPVQQWAVFGEKGGFKGAYELMPMDMILQTLLGLYEARDKVKADLYEITGIADILRGTSDAQETATAQRIKGKFGTLRLQYQQADVQRFARGLVRVGTEIIAKHFSLETLQQVSGVKLLMMAEKQALAPWHKVFTSITKQMQTQQQKPDGGAQQQPQQPQAQSQPPQAQPAQATAPQQPQIDPSALLPPQFQGADTEELAELMEEPTWEEVFQLLRTEPLLSYKIDIETDSTIQLDREEERQARIEFLSAVGSYMQAAASNTNPDLAPLLGKLLMFGVRGFSVGKELESAFEVAIHKLEKDAENPVRQPSPEVMKIQGDMQLEREKMQREDHRLQMQAQVDTNQARLDAQLEQMKNQLEQQQKMALAKLDAETKIAVAQIQAKASIKQTMLSKGGDEINAADPAWSGADLGDGQKQPTIADLIGTVVNQLQQTLGGMQQSHQAVLQSHQNLVNAINRPKQVMRDGDGNITGVA